MELFIKYSGLETEETKELMIIMIEEIKTGKSTEICTGKQR